MREDSARFRIDKSIEHLESAISEEDAVDKAARIAGISRRHFNRIFQEIFGDTTGRHIRARRLSNAAQKLVKTKSPITQIAFDEGFNSHQAFTRAFSSYFGVSPSEYRLMGDVLVHADRAPITRQYLNHLLLRQVSLEPTLTQIKERRLYGQKVLIRRKHRFHTIKMSSELALRKASFGELVRDRIYLTMEPADGRSFYEISDNDYLQVFMGFWCKEPVNAVAGIVLPYNEYAVFQHRCGLNGLQFSYDYIYKTWIRRTELPTRQNQIIQSTPCSIFQHPLTTCFEMEIQMLKTDYA